MFISSCCEPKHILFLFISYHVIFMWVWVIAKAKNIDGLPIDYDFEEVLEYSVYDSDVKIPGRHFPKLPYVKTLKNGYRLGYDEPRSYHKDRKAKYDNGRDILDPMPKLGPSFSRHMKRNLTVQNGKTASLICKVNNIGDKSVSWLKSDELNVLSIGKYKYTTNKRMSILYYPTSEELVLKISPVFQNDSGKYICQISTKPVLNFIMQLIILGKFNSTLLNIPVLKPKKFYQLNDEGSNKSRHKITGPNIYIVNSDVIVHQGETINLTCIAKIEDNSAANITWKQNEQIFKTNHERIEITKGQHKNGSTISNLLIRDAIIRDSGSYSCNLLSGKESTASVKIFQNSSEILVPTSSASKKLICLIDNYIFGLIFSYVVLKNSAFTDSSL